MSDITELVGGPLVGIEEFESRGSTVHTHYDGREIQRTFYLVPRTMAPAVVGAMQGSVAVTEEGVAHRIFPARDPDYKECYCNEVKVTDVDPRAIASSNSLQLNYPALVGDTEEEDRAKVNAWRHWQFMNNLNSMPDEPIGGCFLTASYRPLITGWHADKYYDDILHTTIDQRFDWVNPHFVPSVRTVPWPDGFRIATRGELTALWTATVPDEVAQPVNIPVIEFTVKRLFLGEPAFGFLNAMLNTVNKEAWPNPWPVTASGRARFVGIPQFPKGTLRFDNYEVIEHHSPFPDSPIWYELVYHFSWISLKASPVYDDQGEESGDQGFDDVTWNHVFMRPVVPLVGIPTGDPLGWYTVMRITRLSWLEDYVINIIIGPVGQFLQIRQTVGPLYTLASFDQLFMLNPE